MFFFRPACRLSDKCVRLAPLFSYSAANQLKLLEDLDTKTTRGGRVTYLNGIAARLNEFVVSTFKAWHFTTGELGLRSFFDLSLGLYPAECIFNILLLVTVCRPELHHATVDMIIWTRDLEPAHLMCPKEY